MAYPSTLLRLFAVTVAVTLLVQPAFAEQEVVNAENANESKTPSSDARSSATVRMQPAESPNQPRRRPVIVKQNPLMNSGVTRLREARTYGASTTQSQRQNAYRPRVTKNDWTKVSPYENIPLGQVKCDYERLRLKDVETCRSKEKVFNSMSLQEKLYHNDQANKLRVERSLNNIVQSLSK